MMTMTRRVKSLPSNLNVKQKGLSVSLVAPHLLAFLLGTILLLGVVVGSLFTKKIEGELLSNLGMVTTEFISVKSAQDFWMNFLHSFTSGFLYIFLLFFMGFTAISQPIIIGAVFFKGLGLGLSLGYTYSTLGQNGILAALVFLLPNALFISFSILWAAQESFKLSILFFFQMIRPQNEIAIKGKAKKMCIKYFIITAFYAAGCALEAGIILTFHGYFSNII